MISRSVYLLSLGCAKNLVDSECMSQILTAAGFIIADTPAAASVLIVNTCGFIESAKREAISAILELAAYKQPNGNSRFLIVTGCLAQRYAQEIHRDLPEVDAVLGTGEYGRIAETIAQLESAKPASRLFHDAVPAGSIDHLSVPRQPSNPGQYAYIKIAEGCSNCCAYCAIPSIRGEFHSRKQEDIIAEADRLSRAGRDELILIAQDTGRYGLDLYGQRMLLPLLQAICRLDSVRMVRIMYIYSDGLTGDLIQFIALEPKIAHYLDIPIQHAANAVLARMNRRDTQEGLRLTIRSLREAIPDLVLRTTVMVGFPGETDEEFNELLEFLQEMKFDRLGSFVFSAEEGTPAFSMRPKVSRKIARQRQAAVMNLQKQLSSQANQRRIGQVVPVTLESVDERGIFFIGRSYGEAPEVDPVIFVAAADAGLEIGQTCPVRIVDAGEYDLTGVTEL